MNLSSINSENESDIMVSDSVSLEDGILEYKKRLNAVILAHYYQESEIQDIADYVGDSLELAKKAASTSADVIVFAGVKFMAETAKILNPEKKVIIPDMEAGCSLEEGCPADLYKKFRDQHPDHFAVTYINCSAEVKALSDIICTSSNAEKIINQIPLNKPIFFAPDRNLGAYLKKKTGREMLIWNGKCVVHEMFSAKKIFQLRTEYPSAKLIAHPECEEVILNSADFIGSTSALLKYVQISDASEFIVATEVGIIHQMEKISPGKKFIPAPPTENCACNKCPYMKLNTMEKLYLCMKNQTPEIILNHELMKQAYKPLERMLNIS